MTRRTLIVNADDFGRSPGINRGIVEAHQFGIVTSTTLMVNLPWSADAASLIGDTPTLAVGLHLNLCYGAPTSNDVPSLLAPDSRNFQRDEVALQASMRSEEVEREILAQIARFEELTGRAPDHVDSHRHLHLWPEVEEPLLRIARERGLPLRAYDTDHSIQLRSAGVACSDRCIVAFYGADQITVNALAKILRDIPEGVSELMCHPGYDDAALADSSYRLERETELRTLREPSIRTLSRDTGIVLSTFGVTILTH